MANIEKRGNKYRIRVPVGKDANGKRIFESMMYEPVSKTPTKIEKELNKVAIEFEEKIRKGLYLDGDKLTFEEYLPTWREQWAVDNLSVGQLEQYERMIEQRALPVFGRMAIGSIRPTHIQSIITDMKKENKAVATIKKTMTAINSVFRYAYDMEVIEDNPYNRVRLPKDDIKEGLHYFTSEQTQVFFEALRMEYPSKIGGHKSTCPKSGEEHQVKEYTRAITIPFQWRPYFDLAITGAFRRGELIALRWTDINWEEKTISIRRAFSKTQTKGQILKYPKSEAGIRTLTIPTSSLELLREWYNMEKELSLKLGSLWQGYRGKQFDDNYVFIQLDSGLHMDIDSPTHRFGKIIKMYNDTCARDEDKLPLIRLHDLRHTSATLLLGNGVDIETVSHRLGHKQCSVTLNVYGHWMEDNDRKASDTLEELLKRKHS
ncbi:MAG: tyrosine-type recombinase/integrase [Lachnospiraceae bacterium]|nr:tyrosine-type recombinase/integrase [Lachnospiraceae bacterium]